jgi:ribonucleotide reductase beta subunit family protein with ferritin-like domain
MSRSLLSHPPMVYKKDDGYDYPIFNEYFKSAVLSVWNPWEVSLKSDCQDWNQNTTPSERDLIAGVLRGFTSAELGISCYWSDVVCRMFAKPEIHDMAKMFSAFERIHAAAYNYLSDTLGLNEFEAFMSDETAKKKVERFFTECESDKVSLAVFSGAGEGVSLYSSFAILLAFAKSGRFKGVEQIISWSVIDEACVDGDTEYLTPDGWKKISDYKDGDLVAQFEPEFKEISFVKPSKYIHKQSDEMYKLFNDRRFSQYVTPDHTVIDYREGDGEVRKSTAEEWSKRQSYMPVSGRLKTHREITPLDQFAIALQADGHIRGGKSKREVCFHFKRERKVNRMRTLLSELSRDYGFKYTETQNLSYREGYFFRVIVPDQYLHYRSKFFDQVYTFNDIPKGFIEELIHWDGHDPQSNTGSVYYSSKERRNVEFVQTAASLSGYFGHIFTQDDNRWGKLCRQYRIYLKKRNTVYARNTEKTHVKLDNPIDVYCFKVPTQAFLIRRGGLISVTGNCHSNAGSELFKELVKETGITSEEVTEIWKGFNSILENEFNFLDNIFSRIDNSVIPISLEECKAYIKVRANERFANLDLTLRIPITKEEERLARNVSSWFEPMVKGQISHDAFARAKAGDSYVSKPSQDFNSVDLSSLDLMVT